MKNLKKEFIGPNLLGFLWQYGKIKSIIVKVEK